MAEALGQHGHRVAAADEALQGRQALERLLVGAPDDRHHARQHDHILGAAAELRQLLLDGRIRGLRFLEILHDREHHVGGARGEQQPGLRAAGLQEDRPSLRCAPDIQRSLDLEERAVMVERMDLGGVDIEPGRPVRDQRVVVPAIP